jgi:hypothetical protein
MRQFFDLLAALIAIIGGLYGGYRGPDAKRFMDTAKIVRRALILAQLRLSTSQSADHADENANDREPDYHEEHEAVHHAAAICSTISRERVSSVRAVTLPLLSLGWP